ARPVLLRCRLERARELVVPVRLEVPSLLLETAAERVVRVVVDRRELEHLAELLLCFAPAPDPEVRDPERLADRRLVRLPALRLLERDGGLRGHARPQMAASALEEAVRRFAHAVELPTDPTRRGGGVDRCRGARERAKGEQT